MVSFHFEIVVSTNAFSPILIDELEHLNNNVSVTFVAMN